MNVLTLVYCFFFWYLHICSGGVAGWLGRILGRDSYGRIACRDSYGRMARIDNRNT